MVPLAMESRLLYVLSLCLTRRLPKRLGLRGGPIHKLRLELESVYCLDRSIDDEIRG
jgi:hypothetical protein